MPTRLTSPDNTAATTKEAPHEPVPLVGLYWLSSRRPLRRIDASEASRGHSTRHSTLLLMKAQAHDSQSLSQPHKTGSSTTARSWLSEERARGRSHGGNSMGSTPIYFQSQEAQPLRSSSQRHRGDVQYTRALMNSIGDVPLETGQTERRGAKSGDDEVDHGATVDSAPGNKGQLHPSGSSRKSPAPTRVAPGAPAAAPSPSNGACDGQPGALPCRVGAAFTQHPFLYSLLLGVVVALVGLRLRSRCLARRRLDQGEYRMVAAQYMDSAFDDSLSDDGDRDGDGSDPEDGDDGSWAAANERSIELKSMDRDSNDGLTLEEMNG